MKMDMTQVNEGSSQREILAAMVVYAANVLCHPHAARTLSEKDRTLMAAGAMRRCVKLAAMGEG